MRVLEGEQLLVRVFLGERARWHHQPVSVALVERLRREGFAGATVFHGVAGFGAKSMLHSAHLLRLSEDLPVLVEVVDTPEHVEALRLILDEMVPDGLVTIEPVHVIRYGPRAAP